MKINRGNRDVQENVMNINQDNTKEKENIAVQQTVEAPTLEEIESDVKTTPVQIKGAQVTKKVDPVIKIQKARELIEAKKERDEKLKEIEREKNRLMKKSVGSAPSKLKAKTAIVSQEVKTLADIKREIDAKNAVNGILSTQLRHIDNQIDLIKFYIPVPEDIKLELDNGITILVSPMISYNEIMDLIEWIVSIAATGRSFISIPVLKIVEDMGIMKYYTNLNINDNELLDGYDILARANIIEEVKKNIDQHQIDWIISSVEKTMENIIAYQNSAKGIIDGLNDIAKTKDNNFENLFSFIDSHRESFKEMENIINTYNEIENKNK